MPSLAHTRRGNGPPLVLLHPLGSSRAVWEPVLGRLADRFDVLAPDLPGFGDSPALVDEEPTPAALAASVADLLDQLDIRCPHVAGNSLGGWVALELAGHRPVSSLTLLSPAGLWRRRTPWYTRSSLRLSRWLAVHAERLLSALVVVAQGRWLVLRQTHGRPGRLTPGQARGAVLALSRAPGFDATFGATLQIRCEPAGHIVAPVTVAFGSRDLVLLPWQSRDTDRLPSQTRVERLPGCGHLPVADDPAAVAGLICSTAGRAGSEEPGVATPSDVGFCRRPGRHLA